MSLIFMALRRKWFAFTLFVGVVVVCAFFFGAGMYYTEKAGETYDNLRKVWIRDVDGSVSPFQSIYGSMWWGLVVRFSPLLHACWRSKFISYLYMYRPLRLWDTEIPSPSQTEEKLSPPAPLFSVLWYVQACFLGPFQFDGISRVPSLCRLSLARGYANWNLLSGILRNLGGS
jgi:hypothetical protein